MTGELVAQLTGRTGRKVFHESILAQTACLVKAFGEGVKKKMTKTQIENALHDIGWSKKRLAQEVGLMESAISNCIADGKLSDAQFGHRRRIEAAIEQEKTRVKQAALGVVLDALSERDMGGKVELLLPSETGITVMVNGAVVGHYYPEAMRVKFVG